MLYLRHLTALLLITVFSGAYSQGIDEAKNHPEEIRANGTFGEYPGTVFNNQKEGDLLALVEDNKISEKDGDNVAIEFMSPTADSKYKRGRMIEVRWSGGDPDAEYSLDLYNGPHHYLQIGGLKNSGVYPWIIPSDVEPGKEYKLKLTNTVDFGEFAFSKTFTIKRKTPVALWLVPAAALVVGGVVFLILNQPDPEISDLPAPPEPQ